MAAGAQENEHEQGKTNTPYDNPGKYEDDAKIYQAIRSESLKPL